MVVLISVLAVCLFAVLFTGWVLLLGSPLMLAGSTVLGVPAAALGRVREAWRSRVKRPPEGVLVVHGLDEAPERVAGRVRASLDRVLDQAPAETHPRACACVKASEGEWVGVIRVYNRRGHYLLRTTADTAATVAERVAWELGQFRRVFPAAPGAKRQKCDECDPFECPLRALARSRQRAEPLAA